MTTTTIIPILVGPSDPEFMSHHEFEVKNPRRRQMAEHRANVRKAAGVDVAREFPCRGMLRCTERNLDVWTVQCDACGTRFGIPRSKVDHEQLVGNRLRHSRLPLDLAKRDYDKHTGNEAARAVCRILVERWDTDLQPHPPMLYGATGVGKSHLIAKTGLELAKRRLVDIRYWTVPDLLAQTRRHMDGEGTGADAFIERVSRVELLILDDLGAEQQTDWSRDVLHRIIDHRERHDRPLMGATNIEHGLWADVFGDRVASRLAACTTAVELEGEDYREREQRQTAGNVVPFRAPQHDHTPDGDAS